MCKHMRSQKKAHPFRFFKQNKMRPPWGIQLNIAASANLHSSVNNINISKETCDFFPFYEWKYLGNKKINFHKQFRECLVPSNNPFNI